MALRQWRLRRWWLLLLLLVDIASVRLRHILVRPINTLVLLGRRLRLLLLVLVYSTRRSRSCHRGASSGLQ